MPSAPDVSAEATLAELAAIALRLGTLTDALETAPPDSDELWTTYSAIALQVYVPASKLYNMFP